MIDLLVVSHATFKGVNRYVFDLLRKQHNLKVEIIAPKQLKVAGKWTLADPPEDAAQTMHYLELKGNNPRTHDFDGLFDLLESRKPKGIYLDNDPVSMQALRLGKWARKNGSRLICLSCENLSFYPLASYKRLGGIKGFVNGCIKTGLMYMTKP
ncbi:MAG: hypothetical protein KGS48_18745, partial [Bacteroidetes bacterium]|nr:hypothetical protein [Bacteroidota bacterium]